MSIKPPLTELPIRIAESGFYRGFTKDVTITAKILVGALIIWAVAFPEQAGAVLGAMNSFILASFNYWYVYVMAFFVILCLGLAIWPRAGRMKLGHHDDVPEFSNFSWFSMMFGAGIGIGMLTFATAEPMYHWGTNPDTIRGITEGSTAENVRAAYTWSLTHWGLAAWASYAIWRRSLGKPSQDPSGTSSISSRWLPPFLAYPRHSASGLSNLCRALCASALETGSKRPPQTGLSARPPWA